MPKNKNAALRYEILDQLLRKSVVDRLSKEEIVDTLNEELKTHCEEKGVTFRSISSRTVMQDIRNLRLDYNVVIKLKRRRHQSAWYAYENEFVSIYNKNGMNAKQTYDVREALRRLRSFISHDQFSFLTKGGEDSNGAFRSLWGLFMPKSEQSDFLLDRGAQVLVDRSPEEYEGAKYINLIHEAISHERILKIIYEPFNKPIQEFDFHPSVLKQYNNRWYSFGYDPDLTIDADRTIIAKYRNVALDRIIEVEVINKVGLQARSEEGKQREIFKKIDIEWEAFFSKMIGVSADYDDFKKGHNYVETEKIRIAFHPDQILYEKTKPLHESAKEEKETTKDGWSIRNYELYVNHEFFSQMFHLRDKARILSPEWLVAKFKEKIEDMMNNYEKE